MASSSDRAFSTSLSELLDRLPLGVVHQDLLLALRLLECEPALLERELFRDGGRLRDITLVVHSPRPRQPVLGTVKVGLGELDLAFDRGEILLEDAFLVLDHRDLGDFAGQLGVLVVCLRTLGRDLLVDQLIA